MRALLRASLMALALAVVVAAAPDDLPAEAPAKKVLRKGGADPVRPMGTLPGGSQLDATALAAHIDRLVNQRLRAEKIEASPRADDAEFLRRVSLDLTGRIPTAERTLAFLDSKVPDKRARLIDELLASKEFGRHQADVWTGLMVPHDSEALRLRQYYPHLSRWLEESFNAGKPWDKLVRELLTASGPIDKTGPGVYYLAHASVDKVTDNFTKVFLGVQLQCAQCHNHPFTDWKQDEYWGMAAFFIKVRPDGNPKMAAKKGASISISEGRDVVRGRQRLPESAKILPPKFLQGAKPGVAPTDPYRPVLAEWATSASNPFFARALVNRVWGQLFGRGFVTPVDDLHEGNSPSHPELMADLTGQFTANGFDLKYLLRALCNSAAYQRTSKATGNNGDVGLELLARMPVKVLTPEQLFDSLATVTGTMGDGPVGGRNKAAFGRGPVGVREQFLAFFRIEDGADPTEYQAGIPQVLRLMNAAPFNNPAVAARLTQGAREPREVVEKLYLATLSRRPSLAEQERAGRYLERDRDQANAARADLLWALLNCSEFSLNH